MKIAILGAGNVGGTLGRALLAKDHEVVFGVRNPQSDRVVSLLDGLGPQARARGVADAAAGAEVVLLATPWGATEDVVAAAGDLSGKVLLDATNPLNADLSALVTTEGVSGAEQVANWAPGAHVVKVFNTTGSDNMSAPNYSGSPLTMLYAGDHEGANQAAATLAKDVGFEPVFAGPLRTAGSLEHLALLWITMAFAGGLGPNFAFQLEKRP